MLLSTLHTPLGPHLPSHVPTLSVQHTRYLMYQLLCALKYLDSAGIVHGNIHPHTILVNADSTLKVGFFADAKPGLDKETLCAPYSLMNDGSSYDTWVKSPQERIVEGRRALEVRMGDRSMVWYNSPEILLGSQQKVCVSSRALPQANSPLCSLAVDQYVYKHCNCIVYN
jgi:serine/threonine protein kinase